MKPVKLTLPDTATAKDALIAVNDAPFGIIPVVDQRERLIGVVTRGTLISTFASHWAGGGDEA